MDEQQESKPDQITPSQRKKLRIAAQHKVKTYPLNPSRQYQRDLEMVMRQLAHFIARSGFCPSTKVLARRNTWNQHGLDAYLNDLLIDGLVELHYGKVWTLTEAGYKAIKKLPMKPMLPPELSVKPQSMREAKSIARRLADPETRAAYEAFYAEARDEFIPNAKL